MIFEKLLHGCVWNGNTIIAPSEEDAKVIHKFLREAVLDSHLYVTKVIGFAIGAADSRNQSDTYISRHTQMGDSYVEMMVNLQDKVFINAPDNELTLLLEPGEVYVKDGYVQSFHTQIRTLSTSPYICRNLSKECLLQLRLATSCGYRSIDANSHLIDESYFPMYTHFNISDYVRVIPKREGLNYITLSFYHGFTVEDFKTVLENNYKLYQQHAMRKGEEKWVQSFGL